MHSSRMRTGRSLTVCLSLLLRGVPPSWGVSFLGGLLLGGVSFLGGLLLGGVPPSLGGLLLGVGVGCLLLCRVGGASFLGNLLLGRCLLLGGVSFWGGASFLGVPPSWGGLLGRGGASLAGGIPACTEADTPPMNRITHSCKNITLATTSLRSVTTQFVTKHMNYPEVKSVSRTLKLFHVYIHNNFI